VSSRARHCVGGRRLGHADAAGGEILDACVVVGLNILVSGGTQAGKTTLLNSLTAVVPAREWVITCEEVFELPQLWLYQTGQGLTCPATHDHLRARPQPRHTV
jgi:Type II/IV secretion system protein